MVLIDSIYINYSGGKVLLDYLVECIEANGIDAYYLFDIRCSNDYSFIPNNRKQYLKPALIDRYLFYKANTLKFHTVLCFGNIPPPIRLKANVYTYFHNINLLKIPTVSSLFTRVLTVFKRLFIFFLSVNTDLWIVQTSNTKTELKKAMKLSDAKVLIIPFYKILLNEHTSNIDQNSEKRVGYLYVSNYTKEKQFEFLVEAWIELNKGDKTYVLNLTLKDVPKKLKQLIEYANKEKQIIINHGFLNANELVLLYSEKKAIVYTAVNESLGLGIIEALNYGCDLIGPDLEFIHSICNPSVSYEPFDLIDFVFCLKEYDVGTKPKSVLKIENKMQDIIKLLQYEYVQK